MATKRLSEIQRQAPEAVLGGLMVDSPHASKEAAGKLIAKARDYGVSLRDYLTLAVDPRQSEEARKYQDLNGYEAALKYLNLPVADDFANGVTLDLASDTFQLYPGTRAMFPEVVDDVVQWKYRQDSFERPDMLVSQSRTIDQIEMITTVVDDEAADYQAMGAVAEFGRVSIRTLRTSEQSVKIYKHGYGYRTSYEFERRARLDLLVPYVNRSMREVQMSRTWHATLMLLNGDGVHSAAPEVNQSSYNGAVGSNSTNGQISYQHLLHWLVDRAKAGTPVDTVVGDWASYLQWLKMFAVPTTANVMTDAEQLARSGFVIGGVPMLTGSVNFALSSAAPANKLIGFSRGDTLEELVEANSLINESERSIQNQSITYVKTENSGYRLVFGDTRSVFNYGA